MNTKDSVKSSVIREFLDKNFPGYVVKGSTPYDKGCEIKKRGKDGGWIKCRPVYDSNKTCWEDIQSTPSWHPALKTGFFPCEEIGKSDINETYNKINGLANTIYENVVSINREAAKDFDKFMKQILKRCEL